MELVFEFIYAEAKHLLQILKEAPSEALLDELMQNQGTVEYIDTYKIQRLGFEW